MVTLTHFRLSTVEINVDVKAGFEMICFRSKNTTFNVSAIWELWLRVNPRSLEPVFI